VDGGSVPDDVTDNGPTVRIPCPIGSPAPPSELAAQYVQLLRRATAEPDRSPHTFSLLTEEAAKLLPDPSKAVPDSSGRAASATVLSLFLDHAARHPEVVSRPRRLSEREADVLLAMLEELEEPEAGT